MRGSCAQRCQDLCLMTHLAPSVGAGVLLRHLSRCESDRKLAARSAADRCRGRGLGVTGGFEGISSQKGS